MSPTTHHRITGHFDVTMQPQPQPDNPQEAGLTLLTLGRALLDKRYHGELDATASGQMLSAVTSTPGSAGYVAIEVVTGRLLGRSGRFVLQHSGSMARGEKQLTIHVVPDSGTDALLGLSGHMNIRIVDGQHFYDFDVVLPEPAPASAD